MREDWLCQCTHPTYTFRESASMAFACDHCHKFIRCEKCTGEIVQAAEHRNADGMYICGYHAEAGYNWQKEHDIVDASNWLAHAQHPYPQFAGWIPGNPWDWFKLKRFGVTGPMRFRFTRQYLKWGLGVFEKCHVDGEVLGRLIAHGLPNPGSFSRI